MQYVPAGGEVNPNTAQVILWSNKKTVIVKGATGYQLVFFCRGPDRRFWYDRILGETVERCYLPRSEKHELPVV